MAPRYRAICHGCDEPWGSGHTSSCPEQRPLVLPAGSRLLRDGETPPDFLAGAERARRATTAARVAALEARTQHERLPSCPLRTAALRQLSEALARLEQLGRLHDAATNVRRAVVAAGPKLCDACEGRGRVRQGKRWRDCTRCADRGEEATI